LRNLSSLILIILLILSTPLTAKAQGRRLIAVYEDGRDFPAGWGMFDVKEVRLYEGPSYNYTLELILYKPLDPKVLNYITVVIFIDYDSNESTSMPWPVLGAEYYIVIQARHPFIAWSREINGPGAFSWPLEKSEIRFKWNDTSRIPIIIPGYAFQHGLSRLVSFVAIGLSEEIKERRAVKLSECKEKWARLMFDDYDGLPLDFRSLWIMWDGNRTLGVKVEYYQPVWIKKGDVSILLPELTIGYPKKERKIKISLPSLSLTPRGIRYHTIHH